MDIRKGEKQEERPRTNRFQRFEGKWYCNLRGNRSLGPFESKAEAQVELLCYLREQGLISSVECDESLESALASGF